MSSPMEWPCSTMAAATMTTMTNSGTKMVAKLAMALMPNTTSRVMDRPVMMAHRMYSPVTPGMISSVPRKSVKGTMEAMPWPNTEFCTPNQPTMEMATTPPNRALPPLPRPHQRERRLVDRPSRAAAVPSAQLTTCSSTEPSIVQTKASKNVMP